MEEYFLTAKIVGFHASDGSLKVHLITDFPENFKKQKYFYIDYIGEKKKIFAEKIVLNKNGCVINFKDFSSNERSELLIGKELFIDSSQLVKLKENQFFHHELIGSEVFQNSKLLGKLKEIFTLPAHDVFVIEREGKDDLLVPFVKEIFDSFDKVGKKIFMKTSDGFFEDVV